MVDSLLLFISSFILVGLLGLQSKNVQHSRYLMAALTSIFISISQFIFVKIVATGNMIDLVVVCCGGAIGIVTAIWLHDRRYS